MKFLFIIQGEGRGHMTQAVALQNILRQHGHTVEAAFLGRSRGREVPEFMEKEFGKKLFFFKSPNFLRTADRKGIHTGRSILYNLLLAPVFLREVCRIRRHIHRSSSKVIVNFYDLTGALACRHSFSGKRYFVISHHYFFEHPDYSRPEGKPFMRYLLLLHNRICSHGAEAKLALSFQEKAPLPSGNLMVVPPLLREKVFEMQTLNRNFILVYLLNEGFYSDLAEWGKENPERKILLYTNPLKETSSLPENIQLKRINADTFLGDLAEAGQLICTAGFETVCEAFFFGKSIQVIPSVNHYEQLCNARDAENNGIAGIIDSFSPQEPKEYISEMKQAEFRRWCRSAGEIYVKIFCG